MYFRVTRYDRFELHSPVTARSSSPVRLAEDEESQPASQSASQPAGWAVVLGVEVELSRTRGVRDDGAGTARRGATWPTLPPAAILPRTLLRRTDTRLSLPCTNEPAVSPLRHSTG